MSITSFFNFDLRIERTDGRYRARVSYSPAGEATNTFDSPFAQDDLNTLLRAAGQTRGVGIVSTDQTPTPADAVRSLGGTLFLSVFQGDVQDALLRSRDAARRENKGLRIRLRLTDVPELAQLPWEYLYDARRDDFLATSNRTPIVRYMDLPEAVQPLDVAPPLRIVVMIASPSDHPQLDTKQEWRRLNDALSPLIESRHIALDRLEQATLPALQRKLQEQQYHVFHYIGHGDYDAQSQEGVLLLEDDAGTGVRVDGRRLGVLLRDHASLRLVVLNACRGARSADTDPFAGTAQTLVQRRIPAVIAMQFEITDEAAITFAHDFYGALANGYPVDAALAEARKAIYFQGNDVEWGTPVLFMRSPDGRLFDIEADREEPTLRVTSDETPGDREPTTIDGSAGVAEASLAEYERDVADMVEKLQQRRLVLFIGADLAEDLTGVPSRQTLARRLGQKEGLDPEQRFAQVAQQVMQHGNRWEFTNFLKQHLSPAGAQPGPFYQRLARLIAAAGPELVITTAYHDMLESATRDMQISVVATDSALPFADPSQTILLKLYGDVQQVDSLIVTEQDQNALLRSREKPDMVDEVRRAFRRTSVLFLGYDLRDPAVSALFDEVAGDTFQLRSYAVWRDISEAEATSFQGNRGLVVLPVDPLALVNTLIEKVDG